MRTNSILFISCRLENKSEKNNPIWPTCISFLGIYKALHILSLEYEAIWGGSWLSRNAVHGNILYGTLDIDIESL